MQKYNVKMGGAVVTFMIIAIIVAILWCIIILIQNPKAGFAANFSVANTMFGARESANKLEKATWIMAVIILVLSIASALVVPKGEQVQGSKVKQAVEQTQTPINIPQSPAPLAPQVPEEGNN